MGTSLDDARYFNLATFRKNGAAVETPVWFAPSATESPVVYYVFSAGDAGKVKRLRRDQAARVAACDVRGKLLGEWLPARAELIEGADAKAALTALRRRYGWQMRLADVLARLTGRFRRRAYIRVTLA
ncbi:MAG: PPOX class F420-dependent oxidoreductase [Pseudomonadales bacterium]|nr:PPOX class F420-dependent oxidoreductase [Pseudomonadales bacterium]NIX08039.1 PPOX class F420-dependent oxidoreductase [Pseudomonadales bacterium]